jgi:hypothetical protein
VSCDLGVVGKDTVIADDTVMRNMAIGQDHAITAHTGSPAVPGTTVDSHELANSSIVPDLHGRLFAIKLKVLRISGYYRSREDLCSSFRYGRLP